jgi:multiple sugar transport system permease protein
MSVVTRIEEDNWTPVEKHRKQRKWKSSGTTFGIMMVAPAMILLALVLLYPAFVAFQSSFYKIPTITRQETFVGFDNYYKLLYEPEFWSALRRSFIWTIGAISTQMVFGIAVALVLHKQVRGRSFVRGLVLFPYLVPAIVAVLTWRWIFSDTVGVANYLLVDVFGVLDQPVPWFNPGWVMGSIIIMSLWKYLPYWALFVLARLQTMPIELHEAAQIDGATSWQRFWYITLPWIMPVVIVLLVLRSIWAFNEFDMVFLPAGGGPLSETTTVPVLIRRIAWEQNDIGYAAAVAMAMLVLVAILTNFYFWVYRRAEKRLG